MARKMKNTAATIAPQAPRQTVHNHATNWPLIIIAGVISGGVAMWIVWAFLAFLFYMMDFKTPGQQAAQAVFFLLVIAIAGIISKEILGYIIGKIYDGRIELQKEINFGLRQQQLTAQAGVTTPRQMSEDSRLCKLVMAVMFAAYNDYSQSGIYGSNDQRPWSRRQVALQTIAGETKPVGDTVINGKVRRLLQVEGVIDDGDQINIDDYPNLDFIREMLERRFSMPVRFYGNVDFNGSLPDSVGGFEQIIQK